MLKKQYTKDKKTCKVTFVLPDKVKAADVTLHGEDIVLYYVHAHSSPGDIGDFSFC